MDQEKFVKIQFDIDCRWEGLPPVYRVFVNDELFSERTWNYTDCFLQEILQIQARPGKYRVRLESVTPNLAKFWTSNHQVVYGPGAWVDERTLEIKDESQ